MDQSALGRHIMVELMQCDRSILDDVAAIETAMCEAAANAGATLIQSTFHHFSPYGVSGVVVIQESHLAIHTWPEYEYAAVDLFTCGDSVDPWVSFDHLKRALRAQTHSTLEMRRGSLSELARTTETRSGPAKKVSHQLTRHLWFTDRDENQALSLKFKAGDLFREQSPVQLVRVIDTHAYGKALTLDHQIMCTERDEFHYHEMLVHPALQLLLSAKPDQKLRVLLIGGGRRRTQRSPAVQIREFHHRCRA